jgi:hypothetical protein
VHRLDRRRPDLRGREKLKLIAGHRIARRLRSRLGRSRADRLAPAVQIRGRLPQQPGIVMEVSEPPVACVTKQSAHLLRGVTVINAKPRARLLLADRADAVLAQQHALVVALGQPVLPPQLGGNYFLPIIRILGISLPSLFVGQRHGSQSPQRCARRDRSSPQQARGFAAACGMSRRRAADAELSSYQ